MSAVAALVLPVSLLVSLVPWVPAGSDVARGLLTSTIRAWYRRGCSRGMWRSDATRPRASRPDVEQAACR